MNRSSRLRKNGLRDSDRSSLVARGAVVPELGLLGLLADGTVEGLFGSFLDDESPTTILSLALAASLGARADRDYREHLHHLIGPITAAPGSDD